MNIFSRILTFLAVIASWTVLYVICYAIIVPLAGIPSLLPVRVFSWCLTQRASINITLTALFISCIVSISLAVLLSMPLAAALARFALRTWPIDLSIPNSKRHIKVLKGIPFGVLLYWAMVLRQDYTVLTSIPYDNIESFARWLVQINIFAGETTMLVGSIAIFGIAHLRYAHLMEQPYVFILRRFHSFADRILMGEIIKSTPPGIRPVFIASPGTTAGNWDFWMWSFAGLRFRYPWRNLPFHLRTTDLSWVQNIATLLKNARCVVIEETDYSLSMEIEHKLALGIEPPARVVRLIDDRIHKEVPDVDSHDDSGPQVLYPSFILYLPPEGPQGEKQAPDQDDSAVAPQGESLPVGTEDSTRDRILMVPREDEPGFRVIYAGRSSESSLFWSSVRYKKSYWNAIPGILIRVSAIVVVGLFLDNFDAHLLITVPLSNAGISHCVLLLLYSMPFLIHSNISSESRKDIRRAIESATEGLPKTANEAQHPTPGDARTSRA